MPKIVYDNIALCCSKAESRVCVMGGGVKSFSCQTTNQVMLLVTVAFLLGWDYDNYNIKRTEMKKDFKIMLPLDFLYDKPISFLVLLYILTESLYILLNFEPWPILFFCILFLLLHNRDDVSFLICCRRST